MAYVKLTGRPGCTYKLVDPKSGKTVASATADAAGLVSIASVPSGMWQEQIVITHPVANGPAQVSTIINPNLLDFEIINVSRGPLVTDPAGSVWQITVTTGGVLGATKVIN